MVRYLIVAGLIIVLVIIGITQQSKNQKTAEVTPTAESKPMKQYSKPSMKIDVNKKYIALLKTSKGDVEIELNATATPVTVNNFVYLAGKKYYDNTIFHRVIKGFMIQGGDPTGTGRGNPGYQFNDDPITENYTRGTIAMANAGPNTNGSQFFIMHKDYDLPKNYVIFGHVIKGIEVIDKIAESKVEASEMGEPSKPVEPIKLLSVTITQE